MQIFKCDTARITGFAFAYNITFEDDGGNLFWGDSSTLHMIQARELPEEIQLIIMDVLRKKYKNYPSNN